VTSLSVAKRAHSPYGAQLPTFTPTAHQYNTNASSNPALPNFSRPSAVYMPNEHPVARKGSPLAPPLELQKHRPRQHSQGFFEPSLPTASLREDSNMMARDLTASAIAAQAAMQHQQHMRKRSQTVPSPQLSDGSADGRRNSKQHSPDPPHTKLPSQSKEKETFPGYHNGLVGTNSASLAASAAFPRSGSGTGTPQIASTTNLEQHSEGKEGKVKGERSKMKLFSKPKHIGISRDKEGEKKDKPLPSPNKMNFTAPSGLSRMVNASTTSLAESVSSANSSMYTLNNSSSSTMIPAERMVSGEGREKSHRHHFLSRQKMKLKDKSDDHYGLPLSSASSTSKPLDPSAPQSLYSFTPSSPGGGSNSFSKSVSGLDLRHGGRALREKKKEEKSSLSTSLEPPFRDTDSISEWGGSTNVGTGDASSYLGSTPTLTNSLFSSHTPTIPNSTIQGFGLNNMSAEDAWDFLKAKLLVVFEGEDVRIAVEDLNRLVSIHITRCIQKHAPIIIVEDLRDLLHTGFASLSHTLRSIPDDRLVPHLVRMWLFVFGTILPFMQAVFLPLDLEFKGHGTIMSVREAQEFWGALPESESQSLPSSHAGDELDVRRIVLVSFRDVVILPRYDALKATFSRLSLDSINGNLSSTNLLSTSNGGGISPLDLIRPGTAASLDPSQNSYNSQTSTLLNSGSGTDSLGSRSRAISNVSNTSAPDVQFHSFSSPLSQSTSAQSIRQVPSNTSTTVPGTASNNLLGNNLAPTTSSPPDSSQVTETVTRMLQCVSVLASVQSGGEEQERMERLSKELKLNWLGRGRTGRNRRGFVGTKIRVRSLRDGKEGDGAEEDMDDTGLGDGGVFGRSLL
jgi:hypothetical protein